MRRGACNSPERSSEETFVGRSWLWRCEDVRRKKPPLPIQVNDRLAQMKRESSALVQRAEALDDDKLKEKEALMQQANEVLKERWGLRDVVVEGWGKVRRSWKRRRGA